MINVKENNNNVKEFNLLYDAEEGTIQGLLEMLKIPY